MDFGNSNIKRLSISELNEFIITAAPQELDFVCTVKVTGIDADKRWCYLSCSKCLKKLHRTLPSFTCLTCNNPNAIGVLRYRVEMTVADETGVARFVCFDREMQNLHIIRAYEAAHLLAGDGEIPEDTHVPPFVADMIGTNYTFQVKVNIYNFTANHQSFIISRILTDHGRLPPPHFVAHDGGDDDDDGDDDVDDDADDTPATVSVPTKVDTDGTLAPGTSKVVKRARAA